MLQRDSTISAGKRAWQLSPRGSGTAPPIATTLRAIADAWREGLAACRQYEELRSSGVPHDRAVREALGLGLIPSDAPHEAAPSLYFAGQA